MSLIGRRTVFHVKIQSFYSPSLTAGTCCLGKTDFQIQIFWKQFLVAPAMLHAAKFKHTHAVSTPLRWIFNNNKNHYKKLFTHVESHASTVSLLESGE